MPHTLFISDLHLSAEQPAIFNLFLDFLDKEATRASELYILGDLFDVWLGDDDDTPLAGQVKTALKRLSNRIPVHFQQGNRDFLIGERFASETGVQLLEEEAVITLGGRTVLLMHGDQLCIDDTDYQQARLKLRSTGFIEEFLRKTLSERAAIAAEFRQLSGEATAMKADDIMDVNPQAVARVMQKHGVDTLIHGHTHRPAQHDFQLDERTAHRYVLSDWRLQDTQLLAIDNQSFIPQLIKLN